MKQVVQNLRSGVLELLEVPCPQVARGNLLIATRASLISSGTERSLLEFGQAGLISKLRQQPERVRQVLDKVKSDGLLPTIEAVFAKLDEPVAVGYCNAGVVLEVGAGVEGYTVGDRVASNGQHAEVVNKPLNLCAKIPANVTDEQATFAVLGAIAMQGTRLLHTSLGETVVVYGLGLIGLVAAQLLVSSGQKVLGVDLDPARLALAERFGVTPINVGEGVNPVEAALAATGGHGVDGVLIAAAAKNDDIVSQAAKMSRKRGRIILVGSCNLELSRTEFYEKELTFQVSCSYGPGRYDTQYEERGLDYPYAYVRWTEQRNMQAVLDLIAAGRLDVDSLMTSRIPHVRATEAYDLLTNDRRQLGIVLQYATQPPRLDHVVASQTPPRETSPAGTAAAGIIGAGSFTKRIVLPELRRAGARLVSIASASGVTGAHAARKFGIEHSTTDYRTILADPQVGAVLITTRHNLHARMAIEALEAGKHVFVEKPAAITAEELKQLRAACERHPDRQFVVGFNRRFSPHAVKIRSLLAICTEPATMTMQVNAGKLPADHWLYDRELGGGRIIGEGCHWFDLLSYLVDRPIKTVHATTRGSGNHAYTHDDLMTVTLTFADGSLGTIHYLANGHRSFAKEKLTVFCQGRVLELDNFRRMYGYGWPEFRKYNLFRQDKGHRAEIAGFLERCQRGGPPLMTLDSICNVTAATFAAEESAASRREITLD